jgi:hypothetical protein
MATSFLPLSSFNSSSAKDMNSIKDETNKCRIIAQNSCEIPDEILEIQQIEYEQHLLMEEINRVDAEKQRLQDLLYLVQSMKSNDRKKNTKQACRRRQSIESDSESE